MGGPDIEFGRLVHQGAGTRTLCYTPPAPRPSGDLSPVVRINAVASPPP